MTEEKTTQETQESPKTVLLSTISYSNRADYDQFLQNLTPEHSLIVLISGVNHAQLKGAFSLEEAELIAKAIRRLTPSQSEETQEEVQSQTEAAPPAKKRKKATNLAK
jgi:hypothetical protein